MSETDARSAERAFYDDTDYADVDLELADDVHVTRQPAPRSTFALRLDGSTIEQLREVAHRRGTRPTQLAREWLMERLEQEQQEDEAEVGHLSRRNAVTVDRSPEEALHDIAAVLREAFQGSISSERRFEDRITNLETAFARFSGSYVWGTTRSTSKDADLVADLEARVQVARELRERLDPTATIEAPTDAAADLVVRYGQQTWVIEIKRGTADVASSYLPLLTLATQMDARPVLVSQDLSSKDLEALPDSSGILVAHLDGLESLLADIASHSDSDAQESATAEA